MADYRNVDTKLRTGDTDRPSRTTAQMTAAAIVADISGHLDSHLLKKLHDAMLSHNAHDGRAAIRQAVMSGTRAEDIADFYIPAVARSFGDLWHEDELTFGEVTIAVSRLQSALRDLEALWKDAKSNLSAHATLMLVIPQGTQHTLGAFVLSGQLRRKGISVKLVLGATPQTVVDELSGSSFDAIFVSASQRDTFESLKLIIQAVHAATDVAPPTVIGGTILDVATAEAVIAETGAEYATRHAEEALRFCGLLIATQEDAPNKNGG